MTSTDPLAHERFRTIVAESIDKPGIDAPWAEAEPVVNRFPKAHFKYRTNEAGVRERKVVVESEWEVDLNLDATRADPLAEHGRCAGCGGDTCTCALATYVTAVREDYTHARTIANGMQDRLRAAITDAIAEHGLESREHRRLRWALSGERPVDNSTPVPNRAAPWHA